MMPEKDMLEYKKKTFDIYMSISTAKAIKSLIYEKTYPTHHFTIVNANSGIKYCTFCEHGINEAHKLT